MKKKIENLRFTCNWKDIDIIGMRLRKIWVLLFICLLAAVAYLCFSGEYFFPDYREKQRRTWNNLQELEVEVLPCLGGPLRHRRGFDRDNEGKRKEILEKYEIGEKPDWNVDVPFSPDLSKLPLEGLIAEEKKGPPVDEWSRYIWIRCPDIKNSKEGAIEKFFWPDGQSFGQEIDFVSLYLDSLRKEDGSPCDIMAKDLVLYYYVQIRRERLLEELTRNAEKGGEIAYRQLGEYLLFNLESRHHSEFYSYTSDEDQYTDRSCRAGAELEELKNPSHFWKWVAELFPEEQGKKLLDSSLVSKRNYRNIFKSMPMMQEREIALKWLLKAAEEGDLQAMHLWVDARPRFFSRSEWKKALEFYDILMKSGHAEALATAFESGMEGTIEHLRTVPCFYYSESSIEKMKEQVDLSFIERGDIQRLSNRIRRFLYEPGEEKELYPLLEKLREKSPKDVEECVESAELLENQPQKSRELIISCLEESAEKKEHNVNAAFLMSVIYEKGIGREKDLKKAWHYWKKLLPMLSKNWHTRSEGEWVPYWYAIPEKMIRLGPESGVDELKPELIFEWIKGLYEAEKTYNERKAMHAFFLGKLYEAGKGTTQDIPLALKYYREGAEGGSGYCLYRLGELYEKGLHVEKDRKQALKYYEDTTRNRKEVEVPYEVVRKKIDRLSQPEFLDTEKES